jgi:hypothetical protein
VNRTALVAFAFLAAAASPASAANAAYLSRNGTGSVCTLAAPCSGMGLAIGAAGPGGEVICLDKGNYGGAIINDSITISCGDALWEAPAGTIFLSPPPGTDVVIEGLVLDSMMSSGGNAVNYIGRGSLHLHRVRMGNAGSDGSALLFAPNGAGATLHVSDSVFYNNAGHGIRIRPTGSGFANVHMRNVKFERNGNGLFIDGSASTVGVNVSVTGGVFAENSANGIGAFSTPGAASIAVSVKDAQITGNIGNGLAVLTSVASGAGSVTVTVGGSLISGNVTGVSASGAGQIRTFGNNQLLFNGNNGAFTGSIGLQ